MKTTDNKNEWYFGDNLTSLLEHYVGADYVYIADTGDANSKEALTNHLAKALSSNKAQIIITLHVNALTGDLDDNTNHWVALYINPNYSSNEILVKYVNTMGFPISPEVKNIIQKSLPEPSTLSINQPFLDKPVQYAKKSSNGIEIIGNTDDCGPMLVYALTCISRGVDCIQIHDKEESDSLGSYLRDVFEKKEDFNNIYSTFQKNPHNNNSSESFLNKGDTTYPFVPIKQTKKEYTLPPELEELKNRAEKSTSFLQGSDLNQESIAQAIDEFSEVVENTSKESSKLNDTSKAVGYLEDINRAGYGIFAKVHYALNQENIAKLFYKIAELKSYQAELSCDPKHYTDCATACMYVLSVADNVTKEIDSEFLTKNNDNLNSLKEKSYDLLTKSYNNLVKLCSVSGNPNVLDINEKSIDDISRKDLLTPIRDSSSSRIEEIINLRQAKKDEEYVKETEKYFSDVAKSMQDYLAALFKEAEELIGKAPCEYTVMGLGSMALQQITAYSDLEFAILTENEEYKSELDPKIQNYFKNISYLACFKNICLGETNIPNSYYDIDLSKYIRQAVNFDLGGKTALGRIDDSKPYELIQTVEEMLKYAKNFDDKSEHIDKNLANILEKVCFVYGNKGLMDEYSKALLEFMIQPSEQIPELTNYQYRAYKVLQVGVAEIDYSDMGKAKKNIKGNLEQFKVIYDLMSTGKFFDTKQEIYRIPDRFLYNFCKIFNIIGENAWDSLDQLNLNHKGHLNLKKILSFACLLRSKTYDYYQQQKDKLPLLVKDTDSIWDEGDLVVDGTLFQFYYSVNPLYIKLHEYCNKIQKSNYTKLDIYEEMFYTDSTILKIETCIRLMQWKEGLILCKNFLDQHGEEAISLDHAFVNGEMASILRELGYHKEALHHRKISYTIMQELSEENDFGLVISLNNLGIAYSLLNQDEVAEQCFQKTLFLGLELLKAKEPQAIDCLLPVIGHLISNFPKQTLYLSFSLLEICKESQGENLKTAHILHMIGMCYNALGQFTLSLEYSLEALNLREKLLIDSHIIITESLFVVGDSYHKCANYELALRYYKDAIDSMRSDCRNSKLGFTYILENIAQLYLDTSQYSLALRYYIEILNIRGELLEKNHPLVANSFSKIGDTYQRLEQYELALEYNSKALAIRKELLSKDENSIISYIESLNEMGSYYLSMQKPELALSYYNEALDNGNPIIETLKDRKLVPAKLLTIVSSLSGIGNAFRDLSMYGLALEFYEAVFNLLKILPKTFHGPYINDLAMLYTVLGNHEEALDYKLKALEIIKKNSGDANIKVAIALNNIGKSCCDLGLYKEALNYYLDALEITQNLPEQDQMFFATVKSNLGGVYNKLGQYDTSLKLSKEALDLFNPLVGKQHFIVANTLSDMGNTYVKLNQPNSGLDYQLEALKIRKELFGEKHVDVAHSLREMGIAYNSLEQYDVALGYCKEAVLMHKELLGDQNSHVAISLNNLAITYSYLKQYESAMVYFLEALEIKKGFFVDKNNIEIARDVGNIGTLCLEMNKYAKAYYHLSEAMDIYKEILPDHPEIIKIAANLSLAQQKNFDRIAAINQFHSNEKYFSFISKFLDYGVSLTCEQLKEVKETYKLYEDIYPAGEVGFSDFFELYPYEDNPDFFM